MNSTVLSPLPAAAARGESRRIRTLVVDDSQIVLSLVCEFLEHQGPCDVVGVARNGQEALQQVEALDPDLVIMDLQMPHVDGLKASALMKQHPAARHPHVTA